MKTGPKIAAWGGLKATGIFTEFASNLERSISDPVTQLKASTVRIASAIRNIPAEIRPGLIAMGDHGWYLDRQMPVRMPKHFAAAIAEGEPIKAEGIMIGHFEKRASKICAELVSRHPKRSEVIGTAFAAHDRGEYILSIPALFTQIDGICYDSAKAHLFMSKERQTVVDAMWANVSSEIAAAFLAPLRAETALPVYRSQRARNGDSRALNRHSVLHGQTVDYGTRENGFRAISLLNYISQSLEVESLASE